MATILVIRNDDKFSSTLREAGFNVVNLELIKTRPLEDLSELRDKLSNLREYDGIFFTSPVAAEIFVKVRNGSNSFHGSVYALGGRALQVLESAGLRVKSAIDANTADEMLTEFGSAEFEGRRYLFVRGEKSLRTIPDVLKNLAAVDEVAVYKTESPEIDAAKVDGLRSRILEGEIDLVCFFSPSGVERFAELLGDTARDKRCAAIGKTTADAAQQAGFNVEFISPRSNADDFARGLIGHVKSIE
ncbi:MAG TPA: uroporphyrinogen-III synthase [Pyrinomonadaceae bacterium]|jgi:uroporphyrinogen-III synthase